MGTYNQTTVELACPRCGAVGLMDVEFRFGWRNLIQVNLGDPYPFIDKRRAVHNGGYPPDGNMDGQGYAVCPTCDKDFFVKALIRDGVLTAIEIDTETKPYIP